MIGMAQRVIALLGRRDEPTDAVEEYCRYLGAALQPHGIQLEICRFPWDSCGWPEALQRLRLESSHWSVTWVLVQYTALAWSARGFPQRIRRVLKVLKAAGAKVAVVFHDVEPYSGSRAVDVLRRVVQVVTMHWAVQFADFCFFTVPPEKLSWKPDPDTRVAFVPVGPNLPISAESQVRRARDTVPCVGVFSITGGEAGARETRLIVDALRHAAQHVGKLRLSVFGRHAELRERDLMKGLQDLPVELSAEGVLDSSEVVARLVACDVLFYVRGGISSRRGSAIAGIACGLPVIAFSGSETAPPITEAGVVLVRPGAPEELNTALLHVLTDLPFRAELARRSRLAYESHFAWPAIASRFAAVLKR